MIHLNHEPGHNRARYTANFEIAGRSIRYANMTPFPEKYEYERRIGDGSLNLHFAKVHERFELTLKTDEIDLDLALTGRFPTFDYSACRTAGNPAPSFQEIMTLGLNLPYNHQQQPLLADGTVSFPDGKKVTISGSGYRDHSWVMRADAGSLEHDWCGLNFPSRSFGIKTISTAWRPGIVAKEGYVADDEGLRALRYIETTREGKQADGLCETLIHKVEDVFGNKYTIKSDIVGRHAHVPLASEAPTGGAGYNIVENFCPLELVETGEKGVGLVEIGRNSIVGGPYA